MDRPRGESDPELDFLSSQFNPQKALSTDALSHLPCPEVQPCDNLEHYVSVVKGRTKKETRPQQREEEDSDTCCKKDDQVTSSQHKSGIQQQKIKTVLTFMKEKKGGPIQLLQSCQHNYIEVWTRHSRGLRGVCHGKLIAFDHHFNLILSDVTERYTPLRTVSNGGKRPRKKKKKRKNATTAECSIPIIEDCSTVEDIHLEESQKSTDTCFKEETLFQRNWECIKHVNQIFLRGDNIVLIRPTS